MEITQKYGLLLILILIPTFATYSQSEITIVGIWQTDVKAIISEMAQDKRSSFEQLEKEARDRAEESLGARTYEFTHEGVVKAYWIYRGQDVKFEGTWEVNGNELVVRVNDDVLKYTIEFQNHSKVSLVHKEREIPSIYDRLVLKRKNP